MDVVKPLFDPNWYLETYPDVAKAGVDPWQHYLNFGRYEGRQPCALPAFSFEQRLWFENDQSVLAELEAMAAHSDVHGHLAAWVIARWHASYGRFEPALEYMLTVVDDALALELIGHRGPFLLLFAAYMQPLGSISHESVGSRDSLAGNEHHAFAAALIDHPLWQTHSVADESDKQLARSMLATGVDTGAIKSAKTGADAGRQTPPSIGTHSGANSGDNKTAVLNELLNAHGLTEFSSARNLDALSTKATFEPRAWWQSMPLVTVIVPCYNAEDTIGTALKSLLAQSWPRLEIIVVDDCSSDESVSVIKNIQTNINASQTKRESIRLLVKSQNEGAYAARNLALRHARGFFITTHDADDWSHPQKIEKQVLALLANKQAAASVSHWVRCDNELQFGRWRAEENWVYRNVSSLMFRRSVVKRLGFWDRVSVNADSEYYERIQKVYGAGAITEVMAGVPLSFGRHDASSLSQSSSTHLRTQFFGLRRDYMEAAREWHNSVRSLYLPEVPEERSFIAPLSMCRGGDTARRHHQLLHMQRAQYFDAEYYLSRYSDLAAAGVDAAQHYLNFGGAEGRDPSPYFSSSGYAYVHQLNANENPLIHALRTGNLSLTPSIVKPCLSTVRGGQAELVEKPWLLVCAHSCADGAFGAERSLLDVLQGLAGEFNVLVALPGANAGDYVDSIRALAQHVVVLPYRWWHGAREPDSALIDAFTQLIETYGVCAVYVNTLTLWEPLLAARAAGVKSYMHVRELVEQDPDLCAVLGASANDIRTHVLGLADEYIANSGVVADWLKSAPAIAEADQTEAASVIGKPAEADPTDKPPKLRTPPIHIVPNMVGDMHIPPPAWLTGHKAPQAPMRVGMLSSNLPKKGLHDFIELARMLEYQYPGQFICQLFGPENEHVAAISELPANLHVCGYYPEPAKAFAQLDVVVNMSHFQESFGRSVSEAMAAGRPVAAYDWGALGEILRQGGGQLVRYRDVAAMAKVLRTWQQHPETYRQLHESALQVASGYQYSAFRLTLLRAFDVPL